MTTYRVVSGQLSEINDLIAEQASLGHTPLSISVVNDDCYVLFKIQGSLEARWPTGRGRDD